MIPEKLIYMTGEEQRYLAEALEHGCLCGDGPFTRRCENWLESTLGTARALLTHSCTGALEMAALLCRIGDGDEVIMPSFTFSSTATAFVQRGAVPVFVDVDPVTCNLNPEQVEAAITAKTRAIVPVHYAGYPCQMRAIMDLANRHELYVIEDAAQALLGTDDEKYLGTIGHLGCLSFHESKNVQCGEGGALLVNAREFIQRAEILREKGTNRAAFFRGQIDKYTWVDTGASYIPSELNAAVLWAQLGKAHWITEQKIAHHAEYRRLLTPQIEQGCLRVATHPHPYPGSAHIFFIFAHSLDERTRLVAHLKERGILAFHHYVPLHSSLAGKKFGRAACAMPHTERISDSLLRLPIYPHMSQQDIALIVKAIQDFYSGADPMVLHA